MTSHHDVAVVVAGPCVVCGITNYSLSVGGPSICPKCDCGHFDAATVADQSNVIAELRTKIENQAKALSEARAKLFPYADATEISGMSWSGFYLIGDKKSIRELKRLEHRSAQLEVFSKEYDLRTEALKAHVQAAEARLAEAMKVIERDMEALTEADTQIEYLHDKFKPTGSGANAIARIDIALTAARAFTNAAKTQESKDARHTDIG